MFLGKRDNTNRGQRAAHQNHGSTEEIDHTSQATEQQQQQKHHQSTVLIVLPLSILILKCVNLVGVGIIFDVPIPPPTRLCLFVSWMTFIYYNIYIPFLLPLVPFFSNSSSELRMPSRDLYLRILSRCGGWLCSLVMLCTWS